MARRFAAAEGMTLLCGRFEGVDERVIEHFGIEEVSLGDFVLTGGEIAAQALIDATVRLIPRVLGNQASTEEEILLGWSCLNIPSTRNPPSGKAVRYPKCFCRGITERSLTGAG